MGYVRTHQLRDAMEQDSLKECVNTLAWDEDGYYTREYLHVSFSNVKIENFYAQPARFSSRLDRDGFDGKLRGLSINEFYARRQERSVPCPACSSHRGAPETLNA